jgi:hypothetical protein
MYDVASSIPIHSYFAACACGGWRAAAVSHTSWSEHPAHLHDEAWHARRYIISLVYASLQHVRACRSSAVLKITHLLLLLIRCDHV